MYYRMAVGVVGMMILAEGAWALTYLGPPTTAMRAGQWAVGVEGAWSEQDLEMDVAGFEDLPVDDFEIETVLAQVSVGLATNRMEVFGRIGVVRAEWESIESDEELAVGGGTRITTNLDDPLSWGIVAQGLYWQFDGEEDNIEAQIGLGPCWRTGGFILYGGPMIHLYHAEADDPYIGSIEIDQESWFGAWLGGGVDLWRQARLTAEIQATPDAWGVGANFIWQF